MIEVKSVSDFIDPETMEDVVGINFIISKTDIREDVTDSLALSIGRMILKEVGIHVDIYKR